MRYLEGQIKRPSLSQSKEKTGRNMVSVLGEPSGCRLEGRLGGRRPERKQLQGPHECGAGAELHPPHCAEMSAQQAWVNTPEGHKATALCLSNLMFSEWASETALVLSSSVHGVPTSPWGLQWCLGPWATARPGRSHMPPDFWFRLALGIPVESEGSACPSLDVGLCPGLLPLCADATVIPIHRE